MSIENKLEEASQFNLQDLREVFASINALKFVLDLDGSLNSSVNKDKLIKFQMNLILEDVKDILPELEGIRSDGIVVLRSGCKEEENSIFTLEDVEDILFEMGKERGFIEEIKTTGYSSDG